MNNWLKANGIHLAIIGFFILICFVYFSPVLQGKGPQQSDVLQAKATAKEIMTGRPIPERMWPSFAVQMPLCLPGPICYWPIK